MAKLEKGRSGEYHIFHIGKMAYTVEFNGQVLGQFKSYGRARTFASERHYASTLEAAARDERRSRIAPWKRSIGR